MFRDPVKYIFIALALKAVTILFLIFNVEARGEEPILISVPEQAHQIEVKPLLNGLIQIAYDTDQNGIADQFTVTRQESIHPLFYARDANEDGSWEIVFKDISEDGINGNEEEYLRILPAGK